MTTSVTFRLPFAPASKKNGRKRMKLGRHVKFVPSDKADGHAQSIAIIARQAAGFVMPFGPDDALRIDYEHDAKTEHVVVTVTKVGVIPKKNRGTKRDVHGMCETIADALQGVLYPNDNQIDKWTIDRIARRGPA